MEEVMKPFSSQIDLLTGAVGGAVNHQVRHLEDMRELYLDQEAVKQILNSSNPVIYEVYTLSVPEGAARHLGCCTTIIYPGKIGNEYYMTKGHYHKKRETSEIYLGLSGQGYVLLQDEDRNNSSLEIVEGTLAYVPPHWAHRTVNTSIDKPLIFFAVYHADAGHDYGAIEDTGFAKIVIEEKGHPILADNSRFK